MAAKQLVRHGCVPSLRTWDGRWASPILISLGYLSLSYQSFKLFETKKSSFSAYWRHIFSLWIWIANANYITRIEIYSSISHLFKIAMALISRFIFRKYHWSSIKNHERKVLSCNFKSETLILKRNRKNVTFQQNFYISIVDFTRIINITALVCVFS